MGFTFESRFVCLLIYILCLHAAGIFFFTTGFLLSRNELPIFSTCDDISAHSCPTIARHRTTLDLTELELNTSSYEESTDDNDVATQEEEYTSQPSDLDVTKSSNDISTANLEGGANEEVLSGQCSTRERIGSKNHCQLGSQRVGGGCWTAPAVKRVVILVLDALRFDFVAPSSILTDKPKPWMDKLEVMQQLILEEKSGALMFKFIADPPTTSLQRLKGLTTGSLPTFVDIGNSFGAPAILEDNLLHQLASNGKRVLMMGDDTWLQLFPTQFAEAHPFPSFNVKDLHTVDDGVIDNLFPALYKDNWDVLIGHFLGMDHVGHIFGVESSYMVEKLEQYNRVIENVVSILQNESYAGGMHEDTLLLVMGDHGQTLNGDHGGGALEEVETALFAMSTMQPARSVPINLHRSCSLSYGKGKQTCINTFPQLDFAATLSALVGVPFPFGRFHLHGSPK